MWHVAFMREKRSACRILIRNPKENEPLGYILQMGKLY
jgi:hypothetical protein